LVLAACGDDPGTNVDPTEVRFGDTALVVVVNPTINDANRHSLAAPGTARADITLSSDDGVTDTTDAEGIAVLAPLTPGARTIHVTGGAIDASFTIMLADGALREVALAADATRADVMVDLDYKSDRVFEVVPTMTVAEVNAALTVSDRVVFFKGGTYVGDIDFSASRVTLFGEGVLGGTVTLQGNVTVSGSDSRIRGTHITGTLAIPASGSGLTFSRVDGAVQAEGSDTTLLANALCGGATVTGSGSIVVGNAGAAPTTQCP
ncbi:MAG TPA: hypothetical protein VIV11_11170, partial [Kofleriaceae bacterium]